MMSLEPARLMLLLVLRGVTAWSVFATAPAWWDTPAGGPMLLLLVLGGSMLT